MCIQRRSHINSRVLFHGRPLLAVRLIAHTCDGDHTCSVTTCQGEHSTTVCTRAAHLSASSSRDRRAKPLVMHTLVRQNCNTIHHPKALIFEFSFYVTWSCDSRFIKDLPQLHSVLHPAGVFQTVGSSGRALSMGLSLSLCANSHAWTRSCYTIPKRYECNINCQNPGIRRQDKLFIYHCVLGYFLCFSVFS